MRAALLAQRRTEQGLIAGSLLAPGGEGSVSQGAP